MSGRPTQWTEDDIAVLRAQARVGKTVKQIGSIIGRHPETVRSKAKLLGIQLSFAARRHPKEPTVVVVRPPMPTPKPHTSLTALVMGDPLPGRSALDQKRAGQ